MNTLSIPKLKQKANVYISEDDIEFYLGKEGRNKIIKYSDIDEYKTLNDLLPENIDYKIILLESTLNSGHWVAILRDHNVIEYFNSYGSPISFELDLNTPQLNEELDQNIKHLNVLLTKSLNDFKIIYNTKQFQRLANNIGNCGRWVILRIILFLKNHMNIHQFIDFIDRASKKFNLDKDLLVTFLIYE